MILSAGATDPGNRRARNEDRYHINESSHVYHVADGMGGHRAGEKAADLTVATIDEFVTLAQLSREITWPFGYDVQKSLEYNVLKTATLLANSKVFRVASEMDGYAGMGSTVVVVWIRSGKAYYTHAGDSRLYLWRESHLSRLTEDHSLVQEQLRSGLIRPEEVPGHTLRHVVTQAIGMTQGLKIEVLDLDLQVGDRLLLCSDGLTDEVAEEDISRLVGEADDLTNACQSLIEMAKTAGGRDNVTVLLIEYQND